MKTISAPGEDSFRRFLGAVRPLVDIVEQFDQLLRREEGTGFCYAEYAVAGLEVRLNRVLADLLNPRGPHGQGGIFLESFLPMISAELPIQPIDSWYTIPNFATVRGRYIDLVLRRGLIAIGIEWKPWAREGTDQLEDYACDLQHLSANEHWLVFAPGKRGTLADSITPEKRLALGSRLVNLPFERAGNGGHSIVEWLEACSRFCRADNVRRFIADLVGYLDKQFPSSRMSTQMTQTASDLVVTMTKADGENIRCAFIIEQAAPEMRLTIAREFIAKVVDKLERAREGWIVDTRGYKNFSNQSNDPESIVFRKVSWPDAWGVALEWFKPMTDFNIGYSCPSEGVDDGFCARVEDRARIRAAVEKAVRAACDKVKEHVQWWPAYGPLKEPFQSWTKAQTFVLLAGHEQCDDGNLALASFCGWLMAIADAAEATVDEILSERGYPVGRA